MITPKSHKPKTRNVVLNPVDKNKIYIFLQGAVYCWCKNRPDEWFALRDLMGGDNFDWTDTPMHALYDKQKNKSAPDPVKEAGKEGGRLLLDVIIAEPNRQFQTKNMGLVRHYRWVRQNQAATDS